MATATSSRLLLGFALAAAVLVAGCGGASRSHGGAFAWLRVGAPPGGWTLARLPSGKAALAYPPGWRSIESDPGTVSAALLGPHGRIHGYLNATPQSGGESLSNWARFRPAHNHEEGDRDVVLDASARGLRFRTGSGSCVVDHYTTVSARYKEIACIVRGSRATSVVVGAAEPADWQALAPKLERAISTFST